MQSLRMSPVSWSAGIAPRRIKDLKMIDVEPEPLSPSGMAFEKAAPSYDLEATNLRVSRWLRERIWKRLSQLFNPGQRVLEIGCGTGEDAVWLAQRGVQVLASDASPAMLEQAQEKAREAGVADLITFQQLDLTDALMWNLPEHTFDGAYSNFGALNCIGDWRSLGLELERIIRPGGKLGFGLMGRLCAWEIIWSLLHLDMGKAGRRWSGKSLAHIHNVRFPVYYPTPKRFGRQLGGAFTRQFLMGVGVFLPPSELYVAVGSRPKLSRWLHLLEKFGAALPGFRVIGDHYWIEFKRI